MVNYDFKKERKQDKIEDLLNQLIDTVKESRIEPPDNTDELVALDKLGTSLEALIEKVDRIEPKVEVTTQEYKHSEVDLSPLLKAIKDNKVEVKEVKQDNDGVILKLQDVEDQTNKMSKKLSSDIVKVQKSLDRIPVQKAGSKTDPSEYIPVRLTDGREFYKAIDKMVTALAGSAAATATEQEALSLYGLNDSVVSGSITYLGMEKADGTWCVQEIDTTSGTVFRYATVGNNPAYTTYATAFAARASLTYDYYSEVF